MQQSKFGLQPAIVVLKEGTDTSQGKGQLLTNIKACVSLADILQTTLGPRGMDKMLIKGGNATVSNDGATILSLLDVTHPAARCLVDISKSQDSEIGDGTTSVCVLAGSFLKHSSQLVEDGVHPRIIARCYRKALSICIDRIRSVERKFEDQQYAQTLKKLAGTAMNSKLIAPCKEQFSQMCVDAVLALKRNDDQLDLHNLGIKQVLGGALQESFLVHGIAFKKTFSYAGHEQYKKCIESPKILLLNFELEWSAEKEGAEIRLNDPSKFKEIVEAEYSIIYNKLNMIKEAGATVVFSNKSIGDLATQFFADHGIFGAGRVTDADLKRISIQTNANIISAVSDIQTNVLGDAKLFEEKQIGAERFNFITGFDELKVCTIILRGGAEQFIAESERSLHDAIMVVRRAVKTPTVIAGAGSIEMQLSQYLSRHCKTISGKEQIIIEAFANALEVIPRALCDNAGFDSTDILNQLRSKHAKGIRNNEICWQGVDIQNDYTTIDAMEAFIWEPANIRVNALRSAVEAACIVLLVDQTFNMPNDTQNIKKEQNKTKEMKRKLDAAGVAPSVGPDGRPGAALQQKMGKAARRLK
ncbi:TCP-1 chaperonin subunit eta [Spironucleus salmonicida]|uniref:T-complex protein 1 subunit eta n=1 Tax=Spironucleus salmonicida TaxID=348837 RepID=V6LVA0_9EUKA|nr:TCP-1 chaperonin subunit eta [Spironucleus salmonicida]|eukprot:EST48572.1 TCP-1 chaperonin subunit eta [Spironucleus salmonicida]